MCAVKYRIYLFLILFLSIISSISWAQKTQISFMYWGSAAEDRLIRESLKAFESANPGIEVIPLYGVYSGTDYDAKIRAMAANGTLPDVSYFTMSELFYKYAESGRFLDLTPYIEHEELQDKYLPQTWMSYNDHIYGILTAAECQAVYYNKDVLDDAGISPPSNDYTQSWDWETWLDNWMLLTVDNKGNSPGDPGFDPKQVMRFGVNYEMWSQMLFQAIWSNGGEIFSNDGREIYIDKPEIVDIIKKLSDLRNKYMVMSSPGFTSYNTPAKEDPKILLKEEKIAFYVSGTWELLDFNSMNFPLGIAAPPIYRDPAQVYISGVNVIFSDTKNPEAAWLLQRWLMDTEKNISFYKDGLWMPTEKSWYTEPLLSQWADTPAHPDGFSETIVQSMNIAKFYEYRQKNEDQIWAQYINPALDRIWKGIDDAEEGLRRAARKVRDSGLLSGTW